MESSHLRLLNYSQKKKYNTPRTPPILTPNDSNSSISILSNVEKALIQSASSSTTPQPPPPPTHITSCALSLLSSLSAASSLTSHLELIPFSTSPTFFNHIAYRSPSSASMASPNVIPGVTQQLKIIEQFTDEIRLQNYKSHNNKVSEVS